MFKHLFPLILNILFISILYFKIKFKMMILYVSYSEDNASFMFQDGSEIFWVLVLL